MLVATMWPAVGAQCYKSDDLMVTPSLLGPLSLVQQNLLAFYLFFYLSIYLFIFIHSSPSALQYLPFSLRYEVWWEAARLATSFSCWQPLKVPWVWWPIPCPCSSWESWEVQYLITFPAYSMAHYSKEWNSLNCFRGYVGSLFKELVPRFPWLHWRSCVCPLAAKCSLPAQLPILPELHLHYLPSLMYTCTCFPYPALSPSQALCTLPPPL